jgi:nucleoside-diphosphate-sugar epimerase
MKIVIFGGAGFIGSHLTKLHVKKGDQVYVVDNLITGSLNNIQEFINKRQVTFFNEDIRHFNLDKIGNIDIVYNLASPASPVQYKEHPIFTLLTNAEGSSNILKYIRKYNCNYLYASTSEVYGDPKIHPQKESYWGNVNPVGIRSCYDESKRYGESLCMSYVRKYGLRVRIARIFNTYGPNMAKNDGRVVSNFINQALQNEDITVYGDGQQTRSLCYVADMVQGLYNLATIENIENGTIVNIGNPDEHTVEWLANKIKQLIQSKSNIKFLPIDEDDPTKRKPDITKAEKLLNWEPKVKLDEGLNKTIDYFARI